MNSLKIMIQKIIFFLFLCCNVFYITAQKIDFTFQKTSVFQTVEISEHVTWGKTSFTLGAFVKRGTTYHCVGSVDVIYPLTKDLTFSIYGEDKKVVGHKEGELLRFFMKRHDTTCVNFISQILYDKPTSAYFHQNTKTIIKDIDLVFFGEIYYPNNKLSIICSFKKEVVPQIIDIDPALISFSTYSNNLSIDVNKGIIFPQKSIDNKFDTIYVKTDYCMQTPIKYPVYIHKTPYDEMNLSYVFCDTLPIKLKEENFTRTLIGEENKTFLKDTVLHYEVNVSNGCSTIDTIQLAIHTLTTDSIDVIINPESCKKRGEVIIKSKKELVYYSLNGKKQETPKFEGLLANDYEIIVENKWNCQAKLPMIDLPYIEENCENEETLFLIFSNEEHNHLSFSENQKIQIYNKQGKLIRELQSPVEWDGIDLSGKMLPTGLYIIKYENGNHQFLKVIY